MKLRQNIQIIFMITLISVFVPLLSGCSLAVKGAENDSQDTLIGVFITEKPLDLFNMDSQLKDSAVKLFSNPNNITLDSNGYEPPLYASIDRHNSKDTSDWDVDFEGIKGLKFFAPVWTGEDGSAIHRTDYSDGICDPSTDFLESDQGNETKLSATVYTAPKDAVKSFNYHLNRVYQTASGEIYAVPGSGISVDTEHGEGKLITLNVDDKTEYWDNRQVQADKTSVTVQFAVMYEPVKITLCQMNEDNKIIKQDDFLPGKLPETLNPEKGTAYILTVTEKKSSDGTKTYTRELCGRTKDEEDSTLETYHALDSGVITSQYTQISWGN